MINTYMHALCLSSHQHFNSPDPHTSSPPPPQKSCLSLQDVADREAGRRREAGPAHLLPFTPLFSACRSARRHTMHQGAKKKPHKKSTDSKRQKITREGRKKDESRIQAAKRGRENDILETPNKRKAGNNRQNRKSIQERYIYKQHSLYTHRHTRTSSRDL